MCGRYTRMYTWAELYALYMLTLAKSNFQPRYNICPTTRVDVITSKDGQKELQEMRWGLVPSWWSKPLKELRLATFNARAETVHEKPFFRRAFKSKRCIIPASGYYEWQTIGKEKQPWYFTGQGPVLSIAGIWDEWTDKETGQPLKSCSMIITEPNKFVAEVHDRMPVLLQPAQFDGWLSGELGRESLVPAPEDLLNKIPVSKRVNSSRTPDEDETLIQSVDVQIQRSIM